jgi:hypothetical protein
MTHLHMTTAVSTIRVYDSPGGYEARRAYLGIITVSHLTSSTVYVHGAVGKIDTEYAPRTRRHHGDVRAARANENHHAGNKDVSAEQLATMPRAEIDGILETLSKAK